MKTKAQCQFQIIFCFVLKISHNKYTVKITTGVMSIFRMGEEGQNSVIREGTEMGIMGGGGDFFLI